MAEPSLRGVERSDIGLLECRGGSMQVRLRIRRYNPEADRAPHYEEYAVEAEASDRVLDLLNQVKWYQDGTLAYRRSCAHGICGSDAMRINGVNRLGCKILGKEG